MADLATDARSLMACHCSCCTPGGPLPRFRARWRPWPNLGRKDRNSVMVPQCATYTTGIVDAPMLGEIPNDGHYRSRCQSYTMIGTVTIDVKTNQHQVAGRTARRWCTHHPRTCLPIGPPCPPWSFLQPFQTASLHGKPTMVWAPSCPCPCPCPCHRSLGKHV